MKLLSILFCFTLVLTASQVKSQSPSQDVAFALAQKIMLDLRYYCPQPKPSQSRCFTPMTELPNELKTLIADSGVGGIILFADNLVEPQQISRLTQDLQKASLSNKYATPLFISVDQEGGRVVRLPMQHATAFSGNMAIGATYAKHKTHYATATGHVIGKELAALGFNLNHAPNVDVNINPDNPVINVRSFSESPQQVAELGHAQLKAMQAQGVIGTLKHFPGHGDTNVDSHTGLPRVEHTHKEIQRVDLTPFQYAIDQGSAKMIMTAHIQYPALDSSTLVNKQGQSMIKPATMSEHILTKLLRQQMGFDGVVITDALDMKGISDFFTPTQAVLQTFKAGADIALMPIKITNPNELNKLSQLLKALNDAVKQGELSQAKVLASYARIMELKQSIKPSQIELPALASREHKQLERQLALDSLTAIKGQGKIAHQQVHFIMPDPNKCLAMIQAIEQQGSTYTASCTDFLTASYEQSQTKVDQAQTLVIADIAPKQSLAEIGGMDDLAESVKMNKQARWPKAQRLSQLKAMMAVAKLQNKQIIFVALRAPYHATEFIDLADDVITTYSYTHTTHSDTEFTGPAYQALAQLFAGEVSAQGQLPVTIE